MELGVGMQLKRAVSKTEREREDAESKEVSSWVLSATQRERDSRGAAETIRLRDAVWSLVISTPKSKKKTPSIVKLEGASTPKNTGMIMEDKEKLLRSKSKRGRGKGVGTTLTRLRLELETM